LSRNANTIKVDIVRNNPDTGMKPVKVSYEIPWQERMRVLDVLNYVRDNIDSTLAFRFSCRYYAKCGICSAMVNGKPVLTCYEPARDGMVIAPLETFPVVRDLVIDRAEWDARVSHDLLGISG
jgi:succinate dehydrogenase/fumarate reductase iron-sulfur protein